MFSGPGEKTSGPHQNSLLLPPPTKHFSKPFSPILSLSLSLSLSLFHPPYFTYNQNTPLGIYPNSADKREYCSVRIMAIQYILCRGQLYWRSYDGVHLRCLQKEEAKRFMEEVHQGIRDPHINGRMLAKKNLRMGYYWNTIAKHIPT